MNKSKLAEIVFKKIVRLKNNKCDLDYTSPVLFSGLFSKILQEKQSANKT